MTPVIEVAIGLALLLTIFAALVSGTTETISMLLSKRSTNLTSGIQRMLSGETSTAELADSVMAHPLISALGKSSKGRTRGPSYIPNRVFSTVLLDRMFSGLTDGVHGLLLPSPPEVRTAIAQLPAGDPDADLLKGQWAACAERPVLLVEKLAELDPALADGRLAKVGITAAGMQERLARLQAQPGIGAALANVGGSWTATTTVAERLQSVPDARLQDLGEAVQAIDDVVERIPNDELRERFRAIRAATGASLADFREGLEGWFDTSMDRVSGWYNRWAQKWMLGIGLAVALALNVSAVTVARVLWQDPVLRSEIVAEAEAVAESGAADANGDETAESGAEGSESAEDEEVADTAVGTDVELSRFPIGWNSTAWPGWSWYLILHLFGVVAVGIGASMGGPFWFDALSKLANLRTSGPRPKSNPG